MGVWKFNKGEWTESYVFLRLLGRGRIYGANRDLRQDDTLYLDIKEILRYEGGNIIAFQREIENGNDIIKVLNSDVNIKIVTSPELDEHATLLYNEIKRVKSVDRTFPLEQTQSILEHLGLSTPKSNLPQVALDKYGKKTDIIIKYTTSFDHAVNTNGFSIKSHMGSAATLFNSCSTSTLIYKIQGCTKEKMYLINAISSETEIFKTIRDDSELSLEFIGGGSESFEDNMTLCESRMMEILDVLLRIQIGYFGNTESNSSKDLVKELITINPIKVRNSELYYTSVIKRFLFNSFAGMTASSQWDGRKNLTGGYIDVSKDGDILYYRAMSDDVFESYLFEYTFWDRPSRGVQKDIAHAKGIAFINGINPEDIDLNTVIYNDKGKRKSKKGDWGYVYEKDSEYYIALNFQVRFK